MISRVQYKSLSWIDLYNPTREDIGVLVRDFKIHKQIAEELSNPTERSKVEPYKNELYMILHFPIYDHRLNGTKSYEIDFVIGKDFLVTTHYEEITPLVEYMERFRNTQGDIEEKMLHGGFILFHLLRHLYRSHGDDLRKMELELATIEYYIFAGKHKDMVSRIGEANHTILDFKRALKMHKTTLASLETAGTEFFGSDFSYYLDVITGEFYKIWNVAEDGKELLDDLQKTNDSLLTTHTNEIIKNLTVMAFITFPLMLIASIFGMNTEHTPIIGRTADFWIVILVMLVGMLLMLFWFKYKKWL